MPRPKRARQPPTDDWQQLELRFTSSAQRTYELIRPVVLFGQPPTERAQETHTHHRTIYRHLARFTAQGIAGLLPSTSETPSHTLPDHLRQFIRTLKAEHPPLRVNEMMTICYVCMGWIWSVIRWSVSNFCCCHSQRPFEKP